MESQRNCRERTLLSSRTHCATRIGARCTAHWHCHAYFGSYFDFDIRLHRCLSHPGDFCSLLLLFGPVLPSTVLRPHCSHDQVRPAHLTPLGSAANPEVPRTQPVVQRRKLPHELGTAAHRLAKTNQGSPAHMPSQVARELNRAQAKSIGMQLGEVDLVLRREAVQKGWEVLQIGLHRGRVEVDGELSVEWLAGCLGDVAPPQAFACSSASL